MSDQQRPAPPRPPETDEQKRARELRLQKIKHRLRTSAVTQARDIFPTEPQQAALAAVTSLFCAAQELANDANLGAAFVQYAAAKCGAVAVTAADDGTGATPATETTH